MSGEPPVGCTPPPPPVTATTHTTATATPASRSATICPIRRRSDSARSASERSGVIAAGPLGPAPSPARARATRRVVRPRLGMPAVVHEGGDLAGEPLRRESKLEDRAGLDQAGIRQL